MKLINGLFVEEGVGNVHGQPSLRGRVGGKVGRGGGGKCWGVEKGEGKGRCLKKLPKN